MRQQDHTAANRTTYDRIAPAYLRRQLEYAENGDELFAELERHWRLSIPDGALVADLGCGPALDGLRLSRAGYRVIGADLSLGMLRLAAKNLGDRVAQGDLRSLPLRPASLAGIWCVAAMLHLPEEDTANVLQELSRSLSSGGTLALVTAVGDGSRFEPVPYAPEETRWFVYRQPDQLERQLGDAGFGIRYSKIVEGSRKWFTAVADRSEQ